MKKALKIWILAPALLGQAFGQTIADSAAAPQGPGTSAGDPKAAQAAKDAADKKAEAERKARADELQRLISERRKSLMTTETEGVKVRIGDIARFRGVRANQLLGVGLVVGLEGTGDTKKTPFTQQLLANWLKDGGNYSDPTQFDIKNIATVSVTAELPPFSSPGNKVDVVVQSLGDAKSLQGGFLVRTPLFAAGNHEKAYVVAQGSVSIGGFQAGANGSSVQRNALNVGKLPAGGSVEAEVATKTVFDGKMYLEMEEEDFTTAKRIVATLAEKHPEFAPQALTAGTIELCLPTGMPAVTAMAVIEQTEVFVNIPAVVVINERTGTIVVGGNVKLGPAIVIKGGLNVRIETINAVSQPLPFSQGTTQKTSNSTVSAQEDTTQMAVVIPNTTVADLARIFLELRVSATDMIAILEELNAQGALKAKIKVQ